MKRRSFFKIGLGGFSGLVLSRAANASGQIPAAVGGMPRLVPPAQPAELHMGCQIARVPGRDFVERFDFLEESGYDRAEISGGNWAWLEKNIPALESAIKGRNLKFSVTCISARGNAGMADPVERRAVIDTTKSILSSAAQLKALGTITVPARKKTEMPFPELRERYLKEILPEILEHAEKLGVCLIMEPLNRKETMFLRQVADAAAIARDANSPAIGVLGDFWHMTFEETSDMGAFISAGDYLKHVHIASREHRLIPGLDGEADNYVNGFKGLKLIGFRGAVSIEAGYPKKTPDDEKKKMLARAAKLMRRQWNEA
ncbi:MAG: sugar phosphate isomerase/epimerase [Kiritimatiellae bacterium]|nr:sugar phosphate isomerase/epimerase [Kiritimatiellia bacterium]